VPGVGGGGGASGGGGSVSGIPGRECSRDKGGTRPGGDRNSGKWQGAGVLAGSAGDEQGERCPKQISEIERWPSGASIKKILATGSGEKGGGRDKRAIDAIKEKKVVQ